MGVSGMTRKCLVAVLVEELRFSMDVQTIQSLFCVNRYMYGRVQFTKQHGPSCSKSGQYYPLDNSIGFDSTKLSNG